MRFSGVLWGAQRGGSAAPDRPPRFFRILQSVAACLLFSHAAAYSQGVAASAPSSSASSAGAPVVLPRTIPFKQDSTPASGDQSPSSAVIALALLSGLAGFAFWAWRKRAQAYGAGSAGKGLSLWGLTPAKKNLLLHGTTRLSPRHSVHEVEWRGRRLLIGCADQTMTLLSERVLAEPPEGAAPDHPHAAVEEKP